jgi:hypothetical protein
VIYPTGYRLRSIEQEDVVMTVSGYIGRDAAIGKAGTTAEKKINNPSAAIGRRGVCP